MNTWTNFRTKNKVVMPDGMLYPCFFVVCKDKLAEGQLSLQEQMLLSKVSLHDASSSSAFYYK